MLTPTPAHQPAPSAPPLPIAWPVQANELKPALQLVLAIAHADMGVLLLHDDTVGALRPVVAHNMTEAQCALFGSHSPADGPFAMATTQHRRVRVRDAWRDRATFHDAARSIGFRHVEILPFFQPDGRLLGALSLIFRGNHLSPRSAEKLEACWADVVGLALSHAKARLDAERARERAARASEAKIQFLARMSHELRTPLQSIAGYVDLLRAGTPERLTPSQDRMLARIAESERILVHVIDDVITFARLEAGHVTYNIGPVSAREVLRVADAVVAPLAIDHNIRIEVHPCPEDLVVSADGDKLKQILVNLMANAIKFTGANGAVTLRCHGDAESVWFEVQDTGPGIEADRLRDIFEPYVQLGAPVVDRFGGSGLGLTISREFATGMNGELSATSAVGRGSTFVVRLPRATGARSGQATRASGAPRPRRRRVDQTPTP